MRRRSLEELQRELAWEEWDDETDKKALMIPEATYSRVALWILRLWNAQADPKNPRLLEYEADLWAKIKHLEGSGNRLGTTLSLSAREKITRSKLGKKRKPFTQETIQRMREAKLGAKNGMYGLKASEETKGKLRELSRQREENKRALAAKVIPMPETPSEFTKGQLGKAGRALKRLGFAVPDEDAKHAVIRFAWSINVDPMQVSSRNLAKLYAKRDHQKDPAA